MVKNLPTMQEPRFSPWVRKIPLEKGMATHSNIFARRIPWPEETGGLCPVSPRTTSILIVTLEMGKRSPRQLAAHS